MRDGTKVALKVYKRGPNYDGAVQREQYILDAFQHPSNKIGKVNHKKYRTRFNKVRILNQFANYISFIFSIMFWIFCLQWSSLSNNGVT